MISYRATVEYGILKDAPGLVRSLAFLYQLKVTHMQVWGGWLIKNMDFEVQGNEYQIDKFIASLREETAQ